MAANVARYASWHSAHHHSFAYIAMGKIMEVGFDQVYNLQNSAVSDVSEVISTYIYKIGLGSSQFSLTTAMGFFESIISCSLVLIANRIAKKFDQALF